MTLAGLFIFQVASVVAPVPDAQACSEARDEIVVCHRAIEPDRYRLPLRGDDRPAATVGPPRAEWGLGGSVRMGVSAQSQAMPQGAMSNRAMVSVKIPF